MREKGGASLSKATSDIIFDASMTHLPVELLAALLRFRLFFLLLLISSPSPLGNVLHVTLALVHLHDSGVVAVL